MPSAGITPINQIKGRRAARACKECHLAKSRCSGGLPTCQRCASKGIDCVYYPRAGSRRRQSNSASPRPEQPQSSVGTQEEEDVAMPGLLDSQMRSPHSITQGPIATLHSYQQKHAMLTPGRVTTAIRRYFDHLHCLPSLAFLHRPSIMRLYRAQELEPFLLGAIVAVTSRLPGTTSEECNIGLRCAEMAEELLNKVTTQLSIFRLQAMLLLMRFRLWTGSPCDSLIKMGYLARSAFLLRLNYEDLRPSAFVQESRRRLMWAIYMLDVSLADGLMEYRACPIKAINLRLPCLEDDFELGAETLSEQVTQNETVPSNRVGIIGYYIRMVYFNDQILSYVKLINLKSHANTEKDFFQFEEDLKVFQSRLPGHERFTARNLTLRAYSPRLARFVMTHVWWHVCHCQLFRCLLPTIPETFSQRLFSILGEALVNEYQQKCLEHAIGAANILSSLGEIDKEACVLDMDMAECAFKISEILLLSSESIRAGLGIDRAGIHRHATTCLRFTESMLGLFPAIAPIVSYDSRFDSLGV
ncbi:fungal specific transcription factor domain-containing protein [Sarocladium implicatum]|nr:fungal specific transcription factor domain-containing protein [Sarocladium implicatum]